MKTKYFFFTLAVLVLLALAGSASASAADAAPPFQEGPPVAGEAEAAPEAVLAPDASAIVVGPHVQNVAKTSADILWEAAGIPATTYLHYRKVGVTTWTQYTVAGANISGKYIYKKSLAGLTSNAKYEYQISLNGTTWTPATAAVFITAPGATTSYKVAAWSDSQPTTECKDPHPTSNFQAVLAKMMLPANAPRIALTTGDRVERGQVYEYWKSDYFVPAAKLIQNTCVFPGFGNHEADKWQCGPTTTATQKIWYDDYFTWPGKVAGQRWYAFTYGCVRYIGLDTNTTFFTTPPPKDANNDPQMKWLKTELQSAAFKAAKWQVVFFHHSPYSCIAPTAKALTIQKNVRDFLVKLFEDNYVDLVVGGHFHNYERSVHNGITYIVSGGGGGALDPVPSSCTSLNPDSKKRASVYHFTSLKFTCTNPASLTVQPIDSNGVPIETVTVPPRNPPSTGNCKSFQNGVQPTAAYAGNTDTHIDQHNPTTNYGNLVSVNVDGDAPNGSTHDVNALLKWVIPATEIPAGSTVTSAKIDFWVFNHSGGQVYELYKVKSSWAEGTATWNVKPAWDTVILGNMGPTTAPANYTVALNPSGKSVVQGWVNTPSSNYGLVIRDSVNADGLDFDSSEGATKLHRPMLTVCYNPPTASVLTEAEGEVADVPVEEPEVAEPYTGLASFGGVTNRGLGDATTPLAGVITSLYGRQEGEEAPGALLATSVSDDTGAFGFQANEPWIYDFFVLKAESPTGLISAGTWTIDGSEIGDGTYEWYRPQPDVYAGEFHFDVPLAPEEPAPEPEMTNMLWLPTISR